MHKAIGFIACIAVMAASLYLFSGGDPSRVLSAQTESNNVDSYGSVARRFMNDARHLAKQGNTKQARRLAETAASLSATWQRGEQTPQQFLAELDGKPAANSDNPFSLAEEAGWPALTAAADNNSEPNPFFTDDAVKGDAVESNPLPANASIDMINKHKAQKLMQEAHAALADNDVALARTRAMQARSFKVTWGLWDERPEHLLTEIDRIDGTMTFMADGSQPSKAHPASPEQNKQLADALVQQARAAMNAGKLQHASELADEAAGLHASFDLFEDTPETVKRDLAQLTKSGAAPASAFDQQAVTQRSGSGVEAQAKTLLHDARTAFADGQMVRAKELAVEAQQLNVAYSLLEDRPELVLADIDQAMGEESRNNPFDSASFAQNGPVDVKRDLAQLTKSGAAPASAFDQQAVTQRSGSGVEAQAKTLLHDARTAFADGQMVRAKELAVEAQQLNVAYSLLEDRPELVLADIDQAMGEESRNNPFDSASFAQNGPVDMTPKSAGNANPFANGGVVNLGNAPVNKTDGIALTSNAQEADSFDGPALPSPMAQPDPLKTAANELDVRFMRLRNEVLNSVYRSEKLKEQNSEEAMEILERTMASIEDAKLPEESSRVLTAHIERAQKSIQSYMDARAPMIANEKRNRNVQEQIQTELNNQIRIEQEFADLTNQFNDLTRQRRYAEAELIAKKAKDLNPNLPQAVIMVEKSKLQRQIALIEEIKEKKADYALDALNKVDLAMGAPTEDYNMMDAQSWTTLTDRRSKYKNASSRTRTESERKIEQSLGETISLHFHDVPLTDIVRHIATTHGINIALDQRAIETEGLTTDQAVSIDVDGITLRSALNLLLDQAGGLVYDIENEVLKITNRLEQETRFEVEVYGVADLVVPLGLSKPAGPYDNSIVNGGGAYANGNGLFQMQDDLSVGIGANGSPARSGRRKAADDEVDFSGLIDLITTTIEPGTWDIDGGAGRMDGNENTLSLVIRQTPAVHEQIVELLGQLRKLQDLQVTVEVRFISVTDRFFERIGVDFDFNVQDNLGDPTGVPAFGSRQLTFPGGGGAGGGGGGGQGGDLAGSTNGGGQGGQGGQQNQQGGGGLFDPVNRVNSPRDDFNGQVVGLASPDSFTQDYDISFRQGSFELGVPDFGNFNPDAGIQVGMAILSDIEAFFFIQAAQGDERANILFAPKVTLFNGQPATISDNTTRPFVIGLIPVVGTGAVGFQPIIQPISDGISLTVVAVISADRRFVRLSLAPQFNNVVDVFTFSFASGGAGGGAIGGGQGGGGQGGFGGGGGGFGGGGGGFGGGGGQGGFGGGFGGIGGQGGFGGGGGGQGGGIGGGGQQGQQGQAGGGGGTLTVQQPVQEQISVSTTVSVPDGGTVLLGGIKRLREGRNMAGVPILNKIPYVSRLFKNSGVGRETESVMLMVTPRIIIHEEEEELILGTSGL